MNEDTKKFIAGIIAGGAIVGSGIGIANNLPKCEYFIEYKGEKVCIDASVKEAIESGLKENQGFGGVKFGE